MASSQLNKRMTKYAVVGAIVAIPVPFVGPIIGAAAGAGYAWYKTRKEQDALRPGTRQGY